LLRGLDTLAWQGLRSRDNDGSKEVSSVVLGRKCSA
jgi:hypothetical protein